MTEDVLAMSQIWNFGELLHGVQMILGKSGFPFEVLSRTNKKEE